MAVSRRRLLGGTGAGAAASVLAACGAAGTGTGTGSQGTQSAGAVKFDQPVTLTFWHTQTQSNEKALQDVVAKFNSTNDKRITVKPEFQGGEGRSDYNILHQKNMVAVNAGTPPDFSVAYENMVAEYMRGNWNVDLDDYVKDRSMGLSKESLDDIFPSYLEGLRFPQYGNKLLSFPFTKSLVVMYVNEELLNRSGVRTIPKTWAEFAQAVQATSRNDSAFVIDPNLAQLDPNKDPSRGRTHGWGNYASASTINAWAYSRGGSVLTADNKQVRFLEAPYLDSYLLTEETFKKGYAYSPPVGVTEQDFFANRMAFIQMSSTSRPFLRKVAMDNNRQNMPWRIVSLPQLDPSKPATVQYGANIAVFRTTPLKQAASWAFIKWFTDRDQDVNWSITSSYMPIRKSSSEHPTLKAYWDKEDPQGRQAFELSKYAKPEPNIRGIDPIRPLMQNALRDVMSGKTGSKAALENLTREANAILQQNA